MLLNKRTVNWLTASVVLCGFLAVFSFAAPPDGKGGGKGGGGGGEDPPTVELPPVRYQIQFFDLPHPAPMLEINGTNDLGQVVGRYYPDIDGNGFGDWGAAFLYSYDPRIDAGQAIDLNAIVTGIPDGWRLRSARSINSSGDIAAYLELVGAPTLTLQAVMIDMNATDDDGESRPQLHIIPDYPVTPDDTVIDGYTGGYSLSTDMNDFGDIVAKFRRDDGTAGAYVYNFGLYDAPLETPPPLFELELDILGGWPRINNPTAYRDIQVLGKYDNGDPFRYTLGEGPETFPPVLDPSTGNVMEFDRANDINDAGEFCGQARIYYPKKIKGNDHERLSYIMGNSLETFQLDTLEAFRLNESGDFVTHQGGLYHRSSWESLSPVALLDPLDPDTDTWVGSVASYELNGISDRDFPGNSTDFPQLFGVAELINGDTVGFVLTPVPEP